MSIVHLKRSDETVDRIIKATFPGYTGKSIEAVLTTTVTLYGTMWDEGYKREYAFLRLTDMKKVSVPQEQYGVRSDDHHTPVKIPDGVVVVVHCIGRTDRIEIHSPAVNITPLLEAPANLTEDERTVLKATAGLKASYGGVKNHRFVEARRRTGITLDRWETAKAALIGKRMLNKAGAITIDGRNAIGDDRL